MKCNIIPIVNDDELLGGFCKGTTTCDSNVLDCFKHVHENKNLERVTQFPTHRLIVEASLVQFLVHHRRANLQFHLSVIALVSNPSEDGENVRLWQLLLPAPI